LEAEPDSEKFRQVAQVGHQQKKKKEVNRPERKKLNIEAFKGGRHRKNRGQVFQCG